MAIKLNSIRTPTAVEEALNAGFLYKDVAFDLNFENAQSSELFGGVDDKDLQAVYDSNAILTSIKNILTTTPGEKLLNPSLGLDLRDYLFENVTENKAFFIGQDILLGLAVQEPRVVIDNIEVIAVMDDNEYEITIKLSIPSLKVYELSLKSILNNDGYTFV
jgi:phage baseplate assembly protein W